MHITQDIPPSLNQSFLNINKYNSTAYYKLQSSLKTRLEIKLKFVIA